MPIKHWEAESGGRDEGRLGVILCVQRIVELIAWHTLNMRRCDIYEPDQVGRGVMHRRVEEFAHGCRVLIQENARDIGRERTCV